MILKEKGSSITKNEILNDIHTKIMNGYYLPGDQLNERKLCEIYKISRTPIREVLWSMVSDGIVEQKRSIGFSVSKYTGEQIFEIYQTLEAIEGMAARLACRNANEENINKFKSIKEKLEVIDGTKETDLSVLLGREMDSEIIKASRNDVLKKIYDNLIIKTRIAVNLINSRVSLEETSRKYHLLIIKSILEKNEDNSEIYMREHLSNTRNNLVHQLFPELKKIFPFIYPH